jgi:hypothetical protein
MTLQDALLHATKTLANSNYSSFSEVPPNKIHAVIQYAGYVAGGG